jgi:hypothetical protein
MKIVLLTGLLGVITTIYPSYSFEKADTDQMMQEMKSPTCIYQSPLRDFHHDRVPPLQELAPITHVNALLYLTMICAITAPRHKLQYLPAKKKRRHSANYRFFDPIKEKPIYPNHWHFSRKSYKYQHHR